LGQKVYFKLNWQHIECTPLENILLSFAIIIIIDNEIIYKRSR